MSSIISKDSKTTYININNNLASLEFSNCFYNHLLNLAPSFSNIVILCIGTDRSTGDSLGPLIGYKLSSYKRNLTTIYGTLENPVHAKNIEETINNIYNIYSKPLVIAIDACLGKIDHVGCVTITNGVIKPGAGVNKDLPSIGDIAITGIVNFSGIMDMLILQNTRLNIVMKMADLISRGINLGIWRYENNLSNLGNNI